MAQAITREAAVPRAAARGVAQGVARGSGGFSTLDRISGKIILGLMVLLAGLSAAGAGGAFLMKPAKAHAGLPVEQEPPAMANYARLPAMNFTLTDGDRLRELRVRVVLEMDPQAHAKTVESYGPRITSAMTTEMLDVNAGDLRGRDGSVLIKDAVMRTASKELRPMKVRQVLVQELVLR